MLEGTDEAPRRRWVSKDFSFLFAVGMLVSWINIVFLIRDADFDSFYRELHVDIPLPTRLLFSSRIFIYMIALSLFYLGALVLFWFKRCRKSIWVLSIWMFWNIPFTLFIAAMPLFGIQAVLRKPNTPPYLDHFAFYRPIVAGITWIELGLTLLLVACLLNAIRTIITKK